MCGGKLQPRPVILGNISMADRIPILLDTDIGSDIDDAVCLGYLLRQPRCELLGITTVTGDTIKRAALTDFLCRQSGRAEIPIHAGATVPLWTGPGQREVPQYEVLARRPHRIDFPPATAIEFLRTTIRARPREITLLAIGPMTNVALLFAVDPEIPALLKDLVLMCGVFTEPKRREYNALIDPMATAMAFAARPPRFTSVGLDVTNRCTLPADECRRRFAAAGGAFAFVAEMAEVWFRGRPSITFHDPLAAAILFEPGLCGYQAGEVTVETGADLAGFTAFNAHAANKPHRIALGVDPDRFFAHFFRVTGG